MGKLLKRAIGAIADWESSTHSSMLQRWPKSTAVLDKTLVIFVDKFLANPLFAVILPLLLAAFGADGVAVSLLVAWGVAVCWLARAEWMRRLKIISRLITIIFGGVFLGFAFTSFRNWASPSNKPVLVADCRVPENGSPCEIHCRVRNDSNVEAKNMVFGFNDDLPAGSDVRAPADLRLRLEPELSLPTVGPDGQMEQRAKAFRVTAPVVPAKEKIQFTVYTSHIDNMRACAHVVLMANKRRENVEQVFKAAVSAGIFSQRDLPDIDQALRQIAKMATLYNPSSLAWDGGRSPVGFLDPSEVAANATATALFNKAIGQGIDQKRIYCMAPVFNVWLGL